MVLRRRLAASVRGRYSVRTMAKTLTRNGNSLALTIDKPILEATGIDADTQLEISTDGDVIVISPVRSKKRTAKLEEILGKLDREYAGVFRRLAE
jgi:antitoxin MazE